MPSKSIFGPDDDGNGDWQSEWSWRDIPASILGATSGAGNALYNIGSSLAPWEFQEGPGAGFSPRIPPAIREPVNALSRLSANSFDASGHPAIPDIRNSQNQQDVLAGLLSVYGGNALNPLARVPKGAVAAQALSDTGKPSILGTAVAGAGRDLDSLGYYSGALEAAKNLSQSKGTPEQMLAMLKKEGTKQGEIDATGLGAYLEGKPSITKDELVEHLKKNRLQVKQSVYEPGIQPLDKKPAKWQPYSLDPSNPTYRETVLHLPGSAMNQKDFRSGHFSEPNIIGHMMTSMNKHEGKNVFTLDQIQSDWGLRLREVGVRDEAAFAAIKEKITSLDEQIKKASELPDAFVVTGPDGRSHVVSNLIEAKQLLLSLFPDVPGKGFFAKFAKPTRPEIQIEGPGDRVPGRHYVTHPNGTSGTIVTTRNPELRRLEAERSDAESSIDESGDPGHPLVNSTDQWTNTTLRHALRQAAEAEADYIAIPSGDTVRGYNPGDAHGMNKFYNEIVPKNLGNILKKYDRNSASPRRLDTLEVPSGDISKHKGFSVFDLSPEVRRSILDGGMPLFSDTGTPSLLGSATATANQQYPDFDPELNDILRRYR